MHESSFSIVVSEKESKWQEIDEVILPVAPKQKLEDVLGKSPWRDEALRFAKKFEFKSKAGSSFHFDASAGPRVLVSVLPKQATAFGYLTWSRKAIAPVKSSKAKQVVADLRGVGEQAVLLADTLASALVAMRYKGPKYRAKTEKPEPKESAVDLTLVAPEGRTQVLRSRIDHAVRLTQATNIVRHLAALAGNDLTPTRYVELATNFAKKEGLGTDFYSYKRLEKMKAGAFLAVAQGSEDRGGGILKVTYEPAKGAKKHLALVGKGITFDTGGNNLKTGGHLFGMNNDMTGSALALATIRLAKLEAWPFRVSAYLAITDNILGPRSYRPNDVVSSLKGKTIEIVDTDAEGRMVLSDTLHLASSEKPDLLLDFATLTGAAIRSIGTVYSAAFTNRSRFFNLIRKAGVASGERVWPFPNDRDYGDCLKSDIADIKQCRHTGGVDHIEAAYFLRQFVKPSVPWVHLDLACAENEGGLAHIPTSTTGFGVRFADELIRLYFQA